MKSLPYLQRQRKWNVYPPFGNLLLFLMTQVCLFQHLVSGFSCYQCTSQQAGCEQKMTSSSPMTFSKLCDGGAVGCGVYAFEYEFILPVIFHRGCTYPVDLEQYQWYSTGTEPKGEKSFVNPANEWDHITYDSVFSLWNDTRKIANDPVPVQVFNHPGENGIFRYFFFDDSRGEMSNSISLSDWKKAWGNSRSIPPKKIDSIECYSCDTELGETGWYSGGKRHGKGNEIERLPSCDNMKTVTCEGVYGCATIYMMRSPTEEWKHQFQKSRIWRGCWAPGEMKCVVKSHAPQGGEGRSGQGGKKRTEPPNDECGKAYLESYEKGIGEVAWGGTRVFKSVPDYNKYLECKRLVRNFVRMEDDSEVYEVDEVYKVDWWDALSDDNGYAVMNYRFCGPKAKCNGDQNTPEEVEEKEKRKACETGSGPEDYNSDFQSCGCSVVRTADDDEETKKSNTATTMKILNTSKFYWTFVTIISVFLLRL